MFEELHQHHATIKNKTLEQLFIDDVNRFNNLSLNDCNLLLDYSKQRVIPETINQLCTLADKVFLQEKIASLFSGDLVNVSENRPALHMRLREPNTSKEIEKVQEQMEALCNKVRNFQYFGMTQKPIKNIINVGIGGSDLGPTMVLESLRSFKNVKLNVTFLSNCDGTSLDQIMKDFDPETTLCIINSKTFSTIETMENAYALKNWFIQQLGEKSIKQHFLAVTTNALMAQSFGIDEKNIFEFWNWVGGRYSIWSAIGLPVALLIGMPLFKDFLHGAHIMDEHFRKTSFHKNMPVLMALLGIWNININQYNTLAIIPYDDGLKTFPAYLQQLEMESNGKSALQNNSNLSKADTAPVIWGGVGCNSQHAYMQMLHQGPKIIPVDFILPMKNNTPFEIQQHLMVASCLSQSKALMEGKKYDLEGKLLPLSKFCPGNRPSSTIAFERLTPQILGSLIALYEHKVFVQACIWGINPFDQWGVELGKNLAQSLLLDMKQKKSSPTDASTAGLLSYYYAI